MTVPELACPSSPATESDADVVLLAARTGADGARTPRADGYEWVAPLLAALGATRRRRRAHAHARRTDDGPRRRRRRRRRRASGCREPPRRRRQRRPAAHRHRLGRDRGARPTTRRPRRRCSRAPRSAPTRSTSTAPSPKPPVDAHHAAHRRVDGVAHSTACAPSSTPSPARKDLVNTPPAELSPERFAELAVEAAGGRGRRRPRSGTRPALEADGFGGILGVGQGSSRGPRLVRLEYAPAGASVHLALVGKGITFDSGGLSLKPMASMVGMKIDMAGAATVLAAIVALAELGVPVRVTGWLCLAENMPSGTRDPTERRAAHPRRHDRRGAEHRRRGSARARRRPRRRERRSSPTRSSTSRRSPARRSSRSATASPGSWATTTLVARDPRRGRRRRRGRLADAAARAT